MPSEYYCPHCQSNEVLVYDDHIECLQCGYTFSREIFDIGIDDENFMAEEDLKGVSDAFDEDERKKLEEILKEDDFS